MTMDQLFNNVENAIAQYEQACQEEMTLYEMMQDAEREMNAYSAQASSSEDSSDQIAALQQVKAAAQRYQQYQNQLQQVQVAKAQAAQYLQSTRSQLMNMITVIEEKIPKFNQSISIFEQMASNQFGSSAAAKIPQLKASRDEYQRNLNDAYTLVEKIEAALSGGTGNAPRRVLRR